MTPRQKVNQISNDFRIGCQTAAITEILQVTAVDSVGRNFAVMNHGPVQEIERVRASPPAGTVGWKTAVAQPHISAVFIQTEKLRNLLRPAHPLENAQIFTAGDY